MTTTASALDEPTRWWPRHMSTLTAAIGGVPRVALLPLAAIVALYAPVLVRLADGYWGRPEGAYAPLILAVAVLLVLRSPPRLGPVDRGAAWAGSILFVFGLGALLIGRLLGNMTLEAASAVPVLAGLLAALGGWRALLSQAYPLGMVVVAVPLPGSLVVALTFPLKMAVSRVAAGVLEVMGLPIAREGIVLDVGNYRLLVADACSGLQSLVSLTATALIYLALTGARHPARAMGLIVAVFPIAFMANVVRVLVLALLTITAGERVAQGFLHGFAGMLMFIVAFAGLMLVDRQIAAIRRRTAA